MDWMERAIDVREMLKECQQCPNRWLKETTNVCRNCLYDILSKKMEAEQRAYLEREKKQNGNS